jgi:hypothetical protein
MEMVPNGRGVALLMSRGRDKVVAEERKNTGLCRDWVVRQDVAQILVSPVRLVPQTQR